MTNADSVLIRERVSIDLAVLSNVLCDVYEHSGYPVQGVANTSVLLNPPHHIVSFVAQVAQACVGQVSVTGVTPIAPGSTLELCRLFVHPDAAGQGAGRALVSAVMAFATAHEVALELEVLAKDVVAERLYQELGWQLVRVGERKAPDAVHQARYYRYAGNKGAV